MPFTTPFLGLPAAFETTSGSQTADDASSFQSFQDVTDPTSARHQRPSKDMTRWQEFLGLPGQGSKSPQHPLRVIKQRFGTPPASSADLQSTLLSGHSHQFDPYQTRRWERDLSDEMVRIDREHSQILAGGSAPIASSGSSKTRRPYQQEIVDAWLRHAQSGGDRGLVVLPTGTGKTFTFVESLWELSQLPAYRGKKILVVAHQEQIVAQNAAALAARFGKDQIGIVQGENQEWDYPVISASAQTLVNHLDEINEDEFGLVVLDEAHHYVPGNEWFEVVRRLGFFDANDSPVDQAGKKVLMGFTATPDRLTGKPLVTVYGPHLLYTRDINFFIEQNHLLKPYGIKIDLVGTDTDGKALPPREVWNKMSLDEKAELLAEVMYNPHFHRLDKFKKTVVFLSSREEVEGLETILNQVYGINSLGVLDDTPNRSQKLADFKAGKYDVLLNIRVATEGYDDPGIEAVVLGSGTESRSLVVQEVGRALRPDPQHPERTEAVIADLMGNLDLHEINIPAEEAYTWGSETKLTSPPPTEVSGGHSDKEKKPLGSFAWNTIDIGPFVTAATNQLAPLLKKHLTDEEAVIKAAYLAGLASDKVMLWWHGNSLPAALSEIQALAKSLALADNQLELAYEESVNGAIKTYLIQRLKDCAAELGRSPRVEDLGGKYPSSPTYRKYFGSFNDALRAAGLKPTHVIGELTRDKAIEILKRKFPLSIKVII